MDSLASFQHTLTLTQDRIVANISQKMDSFFEEAEYNWLASQPPPSNEASGYLQDLIDFLSTVMMSVLIQLPEFSKDYVYRGALAHCAMLLMVRDHRWSSLGARVDPLRRYSPTSSIAILNVSATMACCTSPTTCAGSQPM